MKVDYFFRVDSIIKIAVSVGPCDLDPLCMCEATMFLHFGENRYELGMIDLSLAVECVKECMVNALDNNLLIHQSLAGKDIGFLFNQYLYESSQKIKIFLETKVVYDADEEWVGVKYKAWGGYTVSTWLYNTSEGSIVFEAAPVYSGDFSIDDFNHQEFYEWMKNYKPLFVRKISKKTLQDWIKTADQLLQDIAWMNAEGVES